MRKLGMAFLLFLTLLFILPLMMLKGCEKEKSSDNNLSPENTEKLTIKVYRTDINKLVEMDLEEYVLGVVAGEMPASFNIEALKAQALAARTYTVMRMKDFGGKGCQNHQDADVCTDSVHCQAYKNPNNLNNADYKKLKQAVDETIGEVITYNDKLIDAVFHSTSGGKTANSEAVWQAKVPYLRSVISEFEEHSPKYASTKEVDTSSFIKIMKELDSSIKINTKNIKNEIKVLERNEGRVVQIKVGNKEFKGEKFRMALGLNSSSFSFSFGANKIIFTVSGNGHGIGLSQYGADGMGQNGCNYKDIIKHYYTDVEIINMFDYKLFLSNKK